MNESEYPLVTVVCTSPGLQRTMVIPEFVKDEVLRAREVWVDAAGKGAFVARVLRQLGIPLHYVCQGGDNGAEYRELLDHEGLPYTIIPSGGKLRHCTTLIELEPGTQEDRRVASVTELVEPVAPMEAEAVVAIKARVLELLERSSVLAISGSMAPGLPPTIYAEMVAAARGLGIPSVLDIRGQELLHALEHEPCVVKINLSEFVRTFMPEKAGYVEHCEAAHSNDHRALVAESLEDLTEDSPVAIVLTRGPRPVWYAVGGGFHELELPVVPRSRIINPIGSGDSFTAGVAAWIHANQAPGWLVDGMPREALEAALHLGIRCAQENAGLLRPGRIR